MHYMLCRQKVADFEVWKKVLDSHSGLHREAGFFIQQVWRNLDDPNEVFFIFKVGDLDKARAFIKSQHAAQGKEESKALEYPDMWFLEGVK